MPDGGGAPPSVTGPLAPVSLQGRPSPLACWPIHRLNATGPVTVLVCPVSPLQGLGLFCTLTQGDARLGARFALG
jgi:hypothetical protein